jgi:hypothetical protein
MPLYLAPAPAWTCILVLRTSSGHTNAAVKMPVPHQKARYTCSLRACNLKREMSFDDGCPHLPTYPVALPLCVPCPQQRRQPGLPQQCNGRRRPFSSLRVLPRQRPRVCPQLPNHCKYYNAHPSESWMARSHLHPGKSFAPDSAPETAFITAGSVQLMACTRASTL